MKGLFSVAVCSVAALIPTTSWAAAQAPCAPARMEPAVATVPANLPGFGYTALKAAQTDVHLFTTAGAKTEVAVTVGPVADGFLKVVPVAPLVVGASYALEFTSFCSYGPYPAPGPLAFTVTAAAPLPTKLGTATATPTVALKDFGTTRYTITGTYALADEMKPWAAVYALGITFDGKPIETKVTGGASGTVQIVATGWCDEATAARAKHDIVLRGRLPFATTVETAATTLDFVCPAPKIATSPKTTPTVNVVNPDPSAPTSPIGSSNATPTGSSTSGGCSLGARAPSTPAQFPFSALAVTSLVTLLARARRRRSLRIAQGGA